MSMGLCGYSDSDIHTGIMISYTAPTVNMALSYTAALISVDVRQIAVCGAEETVR